MNSITLDGFVLETPEFSHEVYGERFYEFYIECERQSGTIDRIACVVPEILLERINLEVMIRVCGTIRTRKLSNNCRNRARVYVFVTDVFRDEFELSFDKNFAEIEGVLCKCSKPKTTPKGRTITYFLIASQRERNKKTDYIPCIAWGRNALRVAEIPVDSQLNLIGRLQSRGCIKELENGISELRVFHEVSVSMIDVVEESEEKSNED